MPRTKRPTKKPARYVEQTDAISDLAEQCKKRIDMVMDVEIQNIKLAFKILRGTISKEQLNLTLGQWREIRIKEPVTRQASRDDGYCTENSSHGSGERIKRQMAPSSGRSTGRRSRSADASSRKVLPPPTVQRERRRSKSVYRTPAYNKNAQQAYPAITPKVAPNTSLTVLRQPRHGEMVVSMTGSPVMVPTYSTLQSDDKANCNILLKDGTMLSVQPKQLRQSLAYIPISLMDSDVLAQIKTIKDNLEKVIKMGEENLD